MIKVVELNLINLDFGVDDNLNIQGEAIYDFVVLIDSKEYTGSFNTGNCQICAPTIPDDKLSSVMFLITVKIRVLLLDMLNNLFLTPT